MIPALWTLVIPSTMVLRHSFLGGDDPLKEIARNGPQVFQPRVQTFAIRVKLRLLQL